MGQTVDSEAEATGVDTHLQPSLEACALALSSGGQEVVEGEHDLHVHC
jgi:hypothetical protein